MTVCARGETMSSQSLPTSVQIRVILTWAEERGTSVIGRKDWTLGGREVTVQWVWQEVCTDKPELIKRE